MCLAGQTARWLVRNKVLLSYHLSMNSCGKDLSVSFMSKYAGVPVERHRSNALPFPRADHRKY